MTPDKLVIRKINAEDDANVTPVWVDVSIFDGLLGDSEDFSHFLAWRAVRVFAHGALRATAQARARTLQLRGPSSVGTRRQMRQWQGHGSTTCKNSDYAQSKPSTPRRYKSSSLKITSCDQNV
jgi:hypothetical protein